MKSTLRGGFTLIEILLVVAAIAILAGIVIIAINPNKQLADTRNAQRRSDVKTILDAVYQYSIDNGALPGSIPESAANICKPRGNCEVGPYIDISALVTDQKYLSDMPCDPIAVGPDDCGYAISKSGNGRITVSAPNAEQGATISVTR